MATIIMHYDYTVFMIIMSWFLIYIFWFLFLWFLSTQPPPGTAAGAIDYFIESLIGYCSSRVQMCNESYNVIIITPGPNI